MSGLISPIAQPGRDFAPGSVFRAIPASGILTDNDDTLIGGALMDGVVSGGLGDDLFSVSYAGHVGLVEINASFGYLSVIGAAGYLGTVSFWDFERFSLTGSLGNDSLTGGSAGQSTLHGGAGHDLLTIAGSGNLVGGGDGNDTIIGAALNDTVNGGLGTDLLLVDLSGASAGVDLGRGFNAANWRGIEQFAGVLTSHDDTLRGGALMADAFGGAGVDLARLDYSGLAGSISFWSSGAFSHVSFQEPVNDIFSIFLWSFEQFQISGTGQGDFLTGGAGHDLFLGLGGNDTLQGGGGRDTLKGGDGNDYLTGNLDSGSELSGGAGDDTLNVWRLDDTVSGGAGFDVLQLELWDSATRAVIDLVSGKPGWSGIEAVNGNLTRLNDIFRTTTLTGSIDGGQGTDLLAIDYSRSGADRIEFIWGGLNITSGGNSRFVSASSFERYDLRGSLGNDDLTGDTLADTLDGGRGNDRLDGAGGRDVLIGAGGADTLVGGDGNDALDGGAGRDTLVGGAGNDVLTGGTGRDTFYFRAYEAGRDVIADFESGADRIVIEPTIAPLRYTVAEADVIIRTDLGSLRVLNADLASVVAAVETDVLFLI